MKHVFVIVVLPFAIIYSFVARLVHEIPLAFVYAWLDVKGEIESAKGYWNDDAQTR